MYIYAQKVGKFTIDRTFSYKRDRKKIEMHSNLLPIGKKQSM